MIQSSHKEKEIRQLLDSSNWYRAVNLSERYSALAESDVPYPNLPFSPSSQFIDWAKRAGFKSPEALIAKLEEVRISAHLFDKCLNISPEILAGKCSTPFWLTDILAAYNDIDNIDYSIYNAVLNSLLDNRAERILNVAIVLIAFNIKTLLRQIDSSSYIRLGLEPLPSDITSLLINILPKRLTFILSRAVIFELQYTKLTSELTGFTSEERYDNFVEHLLNPEKSLSLFHDFPVLARQVSECLMLWRSAILEMLERLQNDWKCTSKLIAQNNEEQWLKTVEMGAGDYHGGGRSTSILQFSGGGKIVYKPRSVSVDLAFQHALLPLINNSSISNIHFHAIIDKGEYGWEEYVGLARNYQSDQPGFYYESAGVLLSFAHIFGATDLHFENIRSSTTCPHFIDLETLLHPVLNENGRDSSVKRSDSLELSVLRTGYLPRPISSFDREEWYDYSGLGAEDGQEWFEDTDVIIGAGTDKMRIAKSRSTITTVDNRPVLLESPVSPSNYIENIALGYEKGYRLLESMNSSDWSVLKTQFHGSCARIILRETYIYNSLIKLSLHPSMIEDAANRDAHFWNLSHISPKAIEGKIFAEEINSLWRLDIPFLSSSVGSSNLTIGNVCLRNYFRTPPSDFYFGRAFFDDLSNLNRQLNIIRLSIAARYSNDSYDTNHKKHVSFLEKSESQVDLIEFAEYIADRLAQASFSVGDQRTWYCLELNRGGNFILKPASIYLYAGLSGICLFLAALLKISGKSKHKILFEKSFEQLVNQIRTDNYHTPTVGGFTGSGGVLYALSKIYNLIGDRNILEVASRFLDPIRAASKEDRYADIIGGCAGAICGLLSYYKVSSDPSALDVALACGDQLLSLAEPQERGIAWRAMGIGEDFLCGFSHGTAGIAVSLFRLGLSTGQTRFIRKGIEALEFERSQYDMSLQNWRDRRTMQGHNNIDQVTWCHGAPGIGSALLEIQGYLNEIDLMPDISNALQTTIERGFRMNHSLCHGQMGNIDFVLQNETSCQGVATSVRAIGIANDVLKQMRKGGIVTGIPFGYEVPSFMVGISGIGYQMLRLIDPYEIQSVLMLE